MTEQVLRTLRVSSWQIALGVVLAIAGFLAVTQVRNELLIRQQLRLPSEQLAELGFTLRALERNRSMLEQRIALLQEQVRAYEHSSAQGTATQAALERQLEQLRVLVGLTALTGPGVVIELKDSPRPLPPGGDPNTVILHYTDLHSVLNELWASGADAVSLNGIRIITFTSLNCVGTTILCSTKRVAPPYQIVAIGDPGRLLSALQRPGGVLEPLRAFEFPVKVRAESRLIVPAYRGSFQFTHARALP